MASLLESYRQQMVRAAQKRDLNGILSLYADDAVVMPHNDTTLFGKAELKAWWQEYFQFFSIVAHTETERHETTAQDCIFERLAFMMTIVPKEGGAPIRDEMRALQVWTRQRDGSWKISQSIWNSIKPVGAGTSRFMARRLMQKKASRQRSGS